MEIHPTPLWYSMAVVLTLCAAILFVGTFRSPWIFAAWLRMASRMFAATTIGYLVLTILIAGRSIDFTTFWALYTIKTVLLGMSFALVLLFFLSGEVFRVLRIWKAGRPASTNSASKSFTSDR